MIPAEWLAWIGIAAGVGGLIAYGAAVYQLWMAYRLWTAYRSAPRKPDVLPGRHASL